MSNSEEQALRLKVAALDWLNENKPVEHKRQCPASDDSGYGPCRCRYEDIQETIAFIRKCVMAAPTKGPT